MDANEKPEDIIAKECLAVRVRMLNRVVTNLYDDALRKIGLKVSQLNLLVTTAKLGTARPARVCQILQMDASTLSRNVERMIAQGWLEVVGDADGRAQPFRLAPTGRKLLDQALPLWKSAQEKTIEILGQEAAQSLAGIEKHLRA